MNSIDEDLIPAYTCIKCSGLVCKDSISKEIGLFKVICIDCDNMEENENERRNNK